MTKNFREWKWCELQKGLKNENWEKLSLYEIVKRIRIIVKNTIENFEGGEWGEKRRFWIMRIRERIKIEKGEKKKPKYEDWKKEIDGKCLIVCNRLL